MTDFSAQLATHGCGYVEIVADGSMANPNSVLMGWLGESPATTWADCLMAGSAVYWITNVEPLLISQGFARDVALELRGTKPLPVLVFANHSEETTRCVIIPYIQRQLYERALAASERAADKQQAEIQRLQELDRFRSDFLNSLSHELATPITPLKLRVAALAGKLESLDVDATKQMHAVEASIAKVEHFFATLLAAARAQTAELLSPMEEAAIDDVVKTAVQRWQAANPAAPHITLDITPATVEIDAKGLTNCIHQVLDNAAKFAGARAMVSVTADARRVQIADNGPGIPAQKLARIGVPFVKAHDEKQITALGSGLGLFITRRTMENMGGQMIVTSEPGSTVVSLVFPKPAP